MTKKEREKDRKIYRERSVETTVATYGRALLSWVLTTSWLERRRASESVATATRRRRTLTIESACMCVRVKRAHASSTLTPSSPYLNFLKLNSTILFFPPPPQFSNSNLRIEHVSNTFRWRELVSLENFNDIHFFFLRECYITNFLSSFNRYSVEDC